MLHPCDETWGGTTLIESDPVSVTVRDAVYMPVDPSIFLDQFGRWGIFHPDGRLVDEAAYYRFPEHILIGQHPHLPDLPAAEALPAGSYLYGGPVIMHYGHFLITALARLWPMLRGGLPPGTRILVHSHQAPEEWFARDYVRSVFGALGLAAEDFLVLRAPARVPRLLVPRPAFEEQNYVHRVFDELCQRVAAGVAGTGGPPPGAGPVYLSKARQANGTTQLLNEEPLQAMLEELGVRVVYPELLSFAEQVRTMTEASALLGTTGSGLHTTLFTRAPKRIVALNFGRRVNSNFRLIDRLRANSARYLYADGVEPRAGGTATFSFAADDPRRIARELYDHAEGGR